MKKWIKKHLPRLQASKTIKKSPTLNKLKPVLQSPSLWKYDCQSVARGVAAGLAGAVIPGFQFLYAAILAVLFRGNLPVALSLTLITNPFTVLPIIYLIYSIGTLVLGNGNSIVVPHNFKWEFSDFHDFSLNVSAWILQFGKSFFVGVSILSVLLAIIGYFGTLFVWKISTFFLKKKKRAKSKTK